ncbi:MAG: hypothetical protein ACREQM_21865, partial [Candidatus Dormibacteraceae bacterium]
MARVGLLILGVALYGPWLRPGSLLGYDWASGPNVKLPPALYGFGQGRAVGAPVAALYHFLTPLTAGVDPVAIALLLSPLMLGFGMEALLRDQPLAWFAAALLASVNPFVDERLGAASFGVVLAFD